MCVCACAGRSTFSVSVSLNNETNGVLFYFMSPTGSQGQAAAGPSAAQNQSVKHRKTCHTDSTSCLGTTPPRSERSNTCTAQRLASVLQNASFLCQRSTFCPNLCELSQGGIQEKTGSRERGQQYDQQLPLQDDMDSWVEQIFLSPTPHCDVRSSVSCSDLLADVQYKFDAQCEQKQEIQSAEKSRNTKWIKAAFF